MKVFVMFLLDISMKTKVDLFNKCEHKIKIKLF